jgi:hypothetical protein
MRKVKLFGLVTLLMLCAATLAPAQTPAAKPKSPEALVADLYKAHNAKRSPFFQTRSRARVLQYFEKDLADLIWKDAVTSKGEVGVIDGDPLYDAQDMEIKKFAIGKPTIEGNNAKVAVTFENFGEKKTLVFLMVNSRTGWRIHDIDYGDHGTMRSWFKEASK